MNNKLSFINDSKIYLSKPNLDLNSKVRQNINNYLKFDCRYLIENTSSLIFGGAVRDSIANLEIHDMDIVVLPEAGIKISSILENVGFKTFRKYNMDISSLYSNSIINEPITWYKDCTFVQLIRPKYHYIPEPTLLKTFVEQVDLSCCGVSFGHYHLEYQVKEHVNGAIEDCLNHQFRIITSNFLYNEKRIDHRCAKLEARGWKNITSH